jgi:hypothetical protein
MHTTKAFRSFILGLLLLGAAAGPVFSLDVGIEGWMGNLGFLAARTADDATFPGANYFWGLSAYGSQAVTDVISFETGYYYDQILRSTSYTLLNYHADFLTVGFGPFFGLFNDLNTLMKSGISTSVRVELPGVLFVSFRSDSSIGGELVRVGDYLQTRNDISAGVYLPNAICTLSLNSRAFEQKAASAKVVDSLTEYAFSTDIYKKNVPYRVLVTVAYQNLTRSFIDDLTLAATSATLNSVILGMEVDVAITSAILAKVGIEGNVYSFGQGTLVGSCGTFLFRTFAGVKMNVDSFPVLSQIL